MMGENYRIEWIGGDRPEYEPALREEIDEIFEGSPEGLITHTMMAEGEIGSNGASISATWCNERCCIIANYTERTMWVSLSDFESLK